MSTRFKGIPDLSESQHRRVWFIGDATRDEFVGPLKWLQQHTCAIVLGDLSAAMELARERRPDLILLAASFPGQFREKEVCPLRAAFPDAEWVYVYGGWCEGESRTGRPLPDIARIPVSHFSGVIVGKWHRFLLGERPWDSASQACSPQTVESPGANNEKSVALATASPRAAQQLAEALIAAGHSCHYIEDCQPDLPIDVIIWDDSWDVRRPPLSLPSVRRRVPQAPMIALMNAPRVADRVALLSHGVSEIISKPFCIDDLVAIIDALA